MGGSCDRESERARERESERERTDRQTYRKIDSEKHQGKSGYFHSRDPIRDKKTAR